MSKKEEEKKILEEMQKALAERATEQTEQPAYDDGVTPTVIHCRRCKTVMQKGVCPTCGFRMYVPMDKKKRDKIKLIATCVCMAAFVVLFLILQIKNG